MTAPENVLATTGWISDLGVKGLVPALLLAGHVLSDFTIHRRSKAQDGSDAAVRIVHGVLTVAIFFALLVPFLSWLTAVAAATIGILHLVIDAYRAPLCARIGSVRAELLDQGLHLIILGFVWWCLADLTPTLFAVDETTARSIIVVAVGISAYAFVWNGGNELVIAVFAELRPRALEDQHFIDPLPVGWIDDIPTDNSVRLVCKSDAVIFRVANDFLDAIQRTAADDLQNRYSSRPQWAEQSSLRALPLRRTHWLLSCELFR